jgi:hypothetical protein
MKHELDIEGIETKHCRNALLFLCATCTHVSLLKTNTIIMIVHMIHLEQLHDENCEESLLCIHDIAERNTNGSVEGGTRMLEGKLHRACIRNFT